ncbi:MAG: hypothetical protein O7F73_11845 [Gammaproteobacteria bacterium]|nr:hypothetical protein [Gammaproteobacteria bacterium]
MRGLAEYVMRGRMQALWVAVLGASTLMFSWISAAVIALVTLRRGPAEGAYILAWAVLPAGFLLFTFGDSGPLGMIVGTTAVAVILRWLGSWPLALLAAMVVGAGTGFALLTFGGAYLEQLAAVFADFFGRFEGSLPQAQLQAPGVATLAGMLGLINAVSCVLCLLLARWWQAALYNPGGFRKEFHGLRLPLQFSLWLVLGMLVVSTIGSEYRPWAILFAVPLSVAGLGFVHARAAHRKLGPGWLSVFYLLWMLLDPVKLIVVGVAVADSWIDFRSRWPRPDQDEDLQ